MNYVAHDCRNTRLPESHPDYCSNRWLDKDLTRVKTLVPTWKYCRECCAKLGIEFDLQKPSDYTSEAQREVIEKMQNALNTKNDSK